MSADLVIKNGKIVCEGNIFEAGIVVNGGKIAGILSNNILPDAKKVIDAKGKYVLPGIIDLHVHFRDPGYDYKEDFGTGSQAAAAGGVTTVFDMPNNKPPIINVSALKDKIKMAEEKSFVDFALYGGVSHDQLGNIPLLAEAGVIGFKILMGFSVVTTPFTDDFKLLEAFKFVAKTGLPIAIHAENDDIVTATVERLKEEGRTDPLAHLEGRPSIAESEAIGRAIILAHEAGNQIHIVHLSSKAGVNLVRIAKSLGINVSSETCPQYILLEKSHYNKVGSIVKINPPVRSAEDSEGLWEGIHDGTVDAIATDHSPHTPEEKTNEIIWKALSGFTGVETSVSLMLTKVNEGTFKLTDYVRLASENPAKIFNIYPRKGAIRVGSDADFTIVDMDKEEVIKSEKLHSKTRVTPFDGFHVKGIPIYTIVRGNVVMDHGQIMGKPSGKLVTPEK